MQLLTVDELKALPPSQPLIDVNGNLDIPALASHDSRCGMSAYSILDLNDVSQCKLRATQLIQQELTMINNILSKMRVHGFTVERAKQLQDSVNTITYYNRDILNLGLTFTESENQPDATKYRPL